MLRERSAYSSFSADDIDRARAFYAEVLGLKVSEEHGMLTLQLAGGHRVLVYPKDDHVPATYTVLNFEVPDIAAAVDELVDNDVTFARYEGFEQDERGIMRGAGPPIAWFNDPAGNVMAIIQTDSSS
jgi:catechol 2,3-dioxygenase-like lactoylglutathione lyase family enzyme